MSQAAPKPPFGFTAIGIFFLFGFVMATYAGITLLCPGTALDRLWALNATAHRELSALSPIVGIPFLLLAGALLMSGVGWLKHRRWGWMLGVTVISINLAGDLIHVASGDWFSSGVGVAIAGLLLVYMTRPRMRAQFGSGQKV